MAAAAACRVNRVSAHMWKIVYHLPTYNGRRLPLPLRAFRHPVGLVLCWVFMLERPRVYRRMHILCGCVGVGV